MLVINKPANPVLLIVLKIAVIAFIQVSVHCANPIQICILHLPEIQRDFVFVRVESEITCSPFSLFFAKLPT
jgi:hypothetical protein